MGEIEENIIVRLKSFKSQIMKQVEKSIEPELAKRLISVQKYTSVYMCKLKKQLGVEIPIADLKTFEKYDEELEDTGKQNALVNIELLCQFLLDLIHSIYH